MYASSSSKNSNAIVFIGADVSRTLPGSEQRPVADLTASLDQSAVCHAAGLPDQSPQSRDDHQMRSVRDSCDHLILLMYYVGSQTHHLSLPILLAHAWPPGNLG